MTGVRQIIHRKGTESTPYGGSISLETCFPDSMRPNGPATVVVGAKQAIPTVFETIRNPSGGRSERITHPANHPARRLEAFEADRREREANDLVAWEDC